MAVIIVNNLQNVLSGISDASARTLARVGEAVQYYAQDEISRPKMHANGVIRPNVITGDLYRSILCLLEDNGKKKTAYVGTNIPYAASVELGTTRSWAYPYLRPAATDHTEEFSAIVRQEFSGSSV